MRKWLTVYLVLAALAEVMILLIARGTAQNHLEFWEHTQPHKISPGAAAATLWSTMGLATPIVLLIVAAARLFGFDKEDRISVHALGLSILVAALLSTASVVMSMTPALLDLRQIGGGEVDPIEATENPVDD